MGIRQPDDCRCFGGKCWAKFCPQKDKNAKRRLTRKKRPKKDKKADDDDLDIRLWSDSDAYKKEKNLEDDGDDDE